MDLTTSVQYDYDAQRAMAIVCSSIEKSVRPWRPGKIEIMLTNRDFWGGDQLWVYIELLPDLKFVYEIEQRDMHDIYDQDAFAWSVSEAAFMFYRYRPTLPVDDHIILGEN